MQIIRNTFTKIQFKVDHIGFVQRLSLMLALLILIILPWYFLVYRPQAKAAVEVLQQMRDLTKQTMALQARNESIINLVRSHDMDRVIAKFNSIKKELQLLDEQISHFHHRYVSDKELAVLLHSILQDIDDITIENFSTVRSSVVAVTSAVGKTVYDESVKSTLKTAVPNKAVSPTAFELETVPETINYSLSLKGDYFAIMQFLQRIEQVKWQLFWHKLHYKVKRYPNAIATIEFYTVKPRSQPVTSEPATTGEVVK